MTHNLVEDKCIATPSYFPIYNKMISFRGQNVKPTISLLMELLFTIELILFSGLNVALDLWKILPCSTIYLRADPILTYDQYFTTTTTTYGKIIAITILLLCHPENPMNELMKGKYHYLYNFNVNTTHNYKNE